MPYDTELSPTQERQFQEWKAKYAPRDSGADYDLRGAFLAGLTPSANGHWPDTFKKPNHPTFSIESKYAAAAPERAGRWEGENYIRPGKAMDPRLMLFLKRMLANRGPRPIDQNPTSSYIDPRSPTKPVAGIGLSGGSPLLQRDFSPAAGQTQRWQTGPGLSENVGQPPSLPSPSAVVAPFSPPPLDPGTPLPAAVGSQPVGGQLDEEAMMARSRQLQDMIVEQMMKYKQPRQDILDTSVTYSGTPGLAPYRYPPQ